MRAGSRFALAAAAALVLAGLATAAQGTFPGRNGKIAYDSTDHVCGGNPCGRRHIYTINPDGSGRRRLTTQRDTVEPAWSRDGRQIAFSAGAGTGPVFVMDSSGRHLHRIARRGSWPTFSPDGKQVAFSGRRGTQYGIWVVQTDGKGMRLITPNGSDPDWSPDGKHLAIDVGIHAQIYLIKPDGSARRRVTHLGELPIYPSWSPDGKRIAFLLFGKIAMVKASGGPMRVVASDANGKPAWSPDGTRIAYPRLFHDKQSIVTIKSNGSGLHTVVSTVGRASGVSWQRR